MNPVNEASKIGGDTYIGPDGKRYPANLEKTKQGLQLVLGGVRPQTMKYKLAWLVQLPVQPRKQQKPCDVGLFDTESRRQLDLF